MAYLIAGVEVARAQKKKLLIVLVLLLAWPLQAIRLWRRDGDPVRAVFLTLGKLPEALGVLEYWLKRLTGRSGRLIEYK